jgi:uncharacterized protein
MSGYKHIETSVAEYIAGRYRSAIEVGAGPNLHAAELLFRAGILKWCTDIVVPSTVFVPYIYDDIFFPNAELYLGIECIYTIRPVEEMIPPLIRLTRMVGAELCVYHLGFEGTNRPAPIPDCNIPLHRYVTIKN